MTTPGRLGVTTLTSGTADHARAIVGCLSVVDRDALDALSAGQAAAALVRVVEASDWAFCGVCDDRPAFLGGVLVGGRIWMVGTPEIARMKLFYVRSLREMVATMARDYPVLHCMVDASYVRSLRLLARLGFTIGAPVSLSGRLCVGIERVS